MAIDLIRWSIESGNPLNAGIVKVWTNASVFLRVLNFIPVNGFTYTYSEESSLGGIAYRALNEAYADQAYSVVNPKMETLSIVGCEVGTDIALIEAGSNNGQDVRANEIARRQRRAGLFFDAEAIKGKRTNAPKGMIGLYDRIQGNQLITNATNGAVVNRKKLDLLLDSVAGRNNEKILLMNKEVRRQLKDDLISTASAVSLSDVGGSLESYDGARVEIIDEDGDENPILTFDETCGSSNVCTSILCIRPGSTTDKDGIQGLINKGGIRVVDEGIRSAKKYDLVEAHLGFAIFHPRAVGRLQGIIKAA